MSDFVRFADFPPSLLRSYGGASWRDSLRRVGLLDEIVGKRELERDEEVGLRPLCGLRRDSLRWRGVWDDFRNWLIRAA